MNIDSQGRAKAIDEAFERSAASPLLADVAGQGIIGFSHADQPAGSLRLDQTPSKRSVRDACDPIIF